MRRTEALNPSTQEGLKLAQKYPDAPHRQLARMLHKQFPDKTFSACHEIIRAMRGKDAAGTIKRVDKLPKPEMPKSQAEPWEPFYIDAGKTFNISDVHIPYHSELALNSAVKYGKKLKPDTVLINGDGADFYSISRWQRDPRRRNFISELKVIHQFLEWLADEFPTSRIVYKEGNHEERWKHFIWDKAPEIYDLHPMRIENLLELEKNGIEWVEDQRPVMIGKLPVFHGHELPKGIASPVNQARGVFMKMMHSALIGHGHRTSSHTEPDWQHKETITWSQGCLCDLHPEYARVNKWNWGFSWIESNPDKTFEVNNMWISQDGTVRGA